MIRNVVFDIGNVLVRWDPLRIVETAFGLAGDAAAARRHALFGESDIWRALNRGELSEPDAKRAYIAAGLLSADEAERLFAEIYAGLHLLTDTPPLMARLEAAGYRLFALTDNVHEIVAHLSREHPWWASFEGVVSSAAVGCLKPDPRIFRHLLDEHRLEPQETVFFDDLPDNIAGARGAGIHAFVFTDVAQAEADLRSLGVKLA